MNRNSACLVVLGLLFSAPGISQPLPETLKIRFEGGFQRRESSYWGTDAALAYEVVRSGKAQSVQWTMKWLDGDHTPVISRSVSYDLSAIDDFAACAALAPLSYLDIASDAVRPNGMPKLFDASTFDHELLQGHCVAAKAATEVPASHIVAIGTQDVTITHGDRRQQFSMRTQYDALAGLGIDIASSGHDLWSRDGMTRALDPLNDAELVRGIRASAAMRRAALRILANRAKETVSRGCLLAHATPLKPAGPTVVQAILDSESLAQGNSELRMQTMRALAAIKPEAGHPQLVTQLLSGLEQPIEDRRPPAEAERQKRVVSLLGKAAETSEGRPTFRDTRHFEVAAALALASGNDVTNALALRYEKDLTDRVLHDLANEPCTDELVAASPYGGKATIALIAKVGAEKSVIPLIQERIERMTAIALRNAQPKTATRPR
jgi:hypothetical protein